MLLLDDKSILLSFRMQGLGVAKTLQFYESTFFRERQLLQSKATVIV